MNQRFAETRVLQIVAELAIVIVILVGMIVVVLTSPPKPEPPSEPSIEIPAIDVPAPTELALRLRKVRWDCAGRDGCAHGGNLVRIAVALEHETKRLGVPIEIAIGVLGVENPWLDTLAISPAGAIGLMQVMPFHDGEWGCDGELRVIETNICTGMEILAHYMEREGGMWTEALLRYNGCTRDYCQGYPALVTERWVD